MFLIVNVASACGLANKNYRQLKEFHSDYEDAGLHIMAFPCNQFMGQESSCEKDILKFVTDKFAVKFQMYSKIEVNGVNCHPLYKFLRSNSTLHDPNSKKSKEVPWNFAKFLVSEEGKVIGYYNSDTYPDSFRKRLESLLEIKEAYSKI